MIPFRALTALSSCSGIRGPKPDPGPEKFENRIPDPDPQHWLLYILGKENNVKYASFWKNACMAQIGRKCGYFQY